jgi:TolA-binding protein
MTRKRSGLGDLLREEVGKSDGEATSNGSLAPEPAPANTKATPKKTTSPKATPKSADTTAPSLEPQTPVPTAPDPELQAQITALQAQLANQQTQLQELNQAQTLSRQLESELAVAKQTILQLSSQNQAAPTTPAKPVTPAPAATPNRQPLDLQPAPIPSPAQGSTSQPYRFERIGWKPLANHLIQPEAPSTKLSDADLGWVD